MEGRRLLLDPMEDNSSENVTFCREVRDAKRDGARVDGLDNSKIAVIGYGCDIFDAIEDFTVAIKTDRIATLQRLLKCAGLRRVSY
ncbi:hypothetical protein Trydic_g7449 [Trypoxylus dichotomus]